MYNFLNYLEYQTLIFLLFVYEPKSFDYYFILQKFQNHLINLRFIKTLRLKFLFLNYFH